MALPPFKQVQAGVETGEGPRVKEAGEGVEVEAEAAEEGAGPDVFVAFKRRFPGPSVRAALVLLLAGFITRVHA